MFGDRLHVYPIVIAIFVPLTFTITYILAVTSGHVEPAFPYISDTGTKPPESCVFGQLLNIGAVLAFIIFYIRYRQIRTHYEGAGRTKLLKYNTVTFVMGITAALGISLVGNFQETNVIVIHLIGALLAFVVGSIYCWIQTGMSFKMPDLPGNSVIVCRIRTVISVLTFIFIIMLGIFSLLSKLKKPKGESNLNYWNPSVPGYGFRITSTVSEWIVAILIVIFFATFYKEFRYFKLEKPTCSVHDRTRVGKVEQTGNEQPS
ncbi:DNA damage-regulated autophagy modulator protein 1-like isoform X2 [Mytilus californianus]|uniref:DNA damage-regulated autophagy modulator protein 1-like isoform X2 n=1 Tax=Mytilus californianus TaxID=6549 RepID=UPI0022456DB0|nr:DNA damage-regulated autophagy modulator protein 1-like isoform X2 [Mytilus californianus]